MTDGEMVRFGFLFTVGFFFALLCIAAGSALGVFLARVLF